MTKILFCFAGTGMNGQAYANNIEQSNHFSEDVVRIYIEGCQHDKVGGNGTFPDLEIVANKINKAFENNTLDLEKLQKTLGTGLTTIRPTSILKQNRLDNVSQIGLEGYSRGAVTCFAVAKKLDRLEIPIDIIANQPVPGQSTEKVLVRNLYKKYHDLSACRFINSATILLANHNLENSYIENNFFMQMIARFSKKIQPNI